jgi:hypothetical protein
MRPSTMTTGLRIGETYQADYTLARKELDERFCDLAVRFDAQRQVELPRRLCAGRVRDALVKETVLEGTVAGPKDHTFTNGSSLDHAVRHRLEELPFNLPEHLRE